MKTILHKKKFTSKIIFIKNDKLPCAKFHIKTQNINNDFVAPALSSLKVSPFLLPQFKRTLEFYCSFSIFLCMCLFVRV